MNKSLQPIDSALAESLSAKSDEELASILGSPDDWRPEVVDFARAELGRRSVTPAQIEQKVTERKNVELKDRADAPLQLGESVLTVLCGAFLGLLPGLLIVWFRASRLKSDGYLLKARRSWRLFWYGFAAPVFLLAAAVAIVLSLR